MEIINTQAKLDALAADLLNAGSRGWGFDTETTGLDPHVDRVTLIQIGDREKQYVIDVRKVSVEPLRPFFEREDIYKVGVNLKFDYKMMKTSFGIELEGMRDLMLGEKIFHNGRKSRGFSYRDITLNRLNVEIDKTLQKSFINHTGDYSEEQLKYAAVDVMYPIPIAELLAADLQREGLLETWRIESAVSAAFGDMELYGLKIDKVGWQKLIDKNQAAADAECEKMDQWAKNFFRTDLFGKVEVNYSSTAQMLHLLREMKFKVETMVDGKRVMALVEDTNDQTLQKLRKYPLVRHIQDFRSYTMRVTHFGKVFLDAIHPKTGRIHPEFDQLGAETGRPTSHKKSPVNVLNIPREKEMRQCFIAEDGHLIQTDDYSGCELRIWAYLSQDPFLVEAFSKGMDVHCHVASKLYGKEVTKTNENKHLRTPAKSLNFGIAYGMGVNKLYEDLNSVGFEITRDDTKKLYKNYEKELKDGVAFLRQMGRQAAHEGVLVNLAGRKRHWILPNPNDRQTFPKGEDDKKYTGVLASIMRQGGNFVIQSVNAEMLKRSMISLRSWKKKHGIQLEILNAVYDELVTETKACDAEEVTAMKRKIMIDTSNLFLKETAKEGNTPARKAIPMEVDGHVLPYWTK